MLDDLLGTLKHGGIKRHDSEHRRFGHDHGHNYRSDYHAPMILTALRAVFANKVLLATLAIALLVIAALAVWLLITLLSASGPLLDLLNRNGVKGLLETVLSLARRVWEGTGGN